MNEPRDTTDDLLRRRLEGIEMSPPPGVWERIEKSLAELPAAAPGPRITWWRRNRRPLTAAAACLLLMLGATWRIGDMIGPDRGTPRVELAAATPETATAGESAYTPAPEVSRTSEAGTSALSRALGSLRTEHLPQTSGTITEAAEKNLPAVAALTISDETAGTDSAVSAPDQTAPQDRTRQTVKAKHNPDWATLAMEDRTRRSGRRISASVFAGNLSGSSSKHTISGQMAQYSSLGVKEVSDDIRGDRDQSLNTAPRPGNSMESLLETPTVMSVPREEIVLKHRMPVTAGVSITVGLTDRLAIESGLTYTYLRSVSDTKMLSTYNVRQDLHYVGIPLAINYYAVNRDKWGLYLRGGGALEKAVKARRVTSITTRDNGNTKTSESMKVKGLQPSLNGSLGVEWRFARLLSIYAEPGVGYYFERTSQPDSYRTEHPVSFNLKMGLRVNFRQ